MLYELIYNIRGTYSNGEPIIIDDFHEEECANHMDATNKAKARCDARKAELIAQGHTVESVHSGYVGPHE